MKRDEYTRPGSDARIITWSRFGKLKRVIVANKNVPREWFDADPDDYDALVELLALPTYWSMHAHIYGVPL